MKGQSYLMIGAGKAIGIIGKVKKIMLISTPYYVPCTLPFWSDWRRLKTDLAVHGYGHK